MQNCMRYMIMIKLKSKKIAEELNTQSLDENEIFTNENIDIICICAPNVFHKTYIIKAIQNNKHVFCEKPLVKNLKEAEEIIKLTKNYKKKYKLVQITDFLKA